MCYLVIKATERCEQGHLLSAVCCYRQCEKVPAFEDRKFATALCSDPLKKHNLPFIKVIHRQINITKDCKVCDELKPLKDALEEADANRRAMQQNLDEHVVKHPKDIHAIKQFEIGSGAATRRYGYAHSDFINAQRKCHKANFNRINKEAFDRFDDSAPIFYQGSITQTERDMYPEMARKKDFLRLTVHEISTQFPEQIVDWTSTGLKVWSI